MIQKGIINDDVSYMIVARADIGKHSLHITRTSKECKIMQLGKHPTDEEYNLFDINYRDQVTELIIKENIKFSTHSLFIIVCGEINERLEEEDIEEYLKDFPEFKWVRPRVKPGKTGREIMQDYLRDHYIVHRRLKRPKRSLWEIMSDFIR
jgi:hypothetical protein